MTTWIVETHIDTGERFRNEFKGEEPSGHLLHPISYPKDRAEDFARRICNGGAFKTKSIVVSTWYPSHRIKEVHVYEKEED